jgi:hypothetical protein
MFQPHSLYWIGLLEPVYPESWRWFFHVDVTPSIWHFVLRFMGGGEEDLRLLLLCHRC